MIYRNDITAEELRSIIKYDLESGIFTRNGKIIGSKSARGYSIITINNIKYYAHRLAWLLTTGEWPKKDIDHINLVKTDNRFINLREANDASNKANSYTYKNNRCGIKGVQKINERWRARITVNKKLIHLGFFSSSEEAQAAYLMAAKKYYGEYARGF